MSQFLNDKVLMRLRTFYEKYKKQVVYFIALSATLGSLSISEIFGWSVFTLSTLQRILMYPITIISGLSIIYDSSELFKINIMLSSIGLITSIYHASSIAANTMSSCGFIFPCHTNSRILLFGITIKPIYIPTMAGISFAGITIIILTDIIKNN